MKSKYVKNVDCHIGVTTVGEKGQIVVPADVREALHLAKGERLMVITRDADSFLFIRPNKVEYFAERLSEGLRKTKNEERNTKKKKK
jgi:AbrB family looped-hinge helix DNA binding protein